MLQYNVCVESSKAKNLLISAIADFYRAAVRFVKAVDEKGEGGAGLAAEGGQGESGEMLVGNPQLEVGFLHPRFLVYEDPSYHDLEHAYLRFPAFESLLFFDRSTAHSIILFRQHFPALVGRPSSHTHRNVRRRVN